MASKEIGSQVVVDLDREREIEAEARAAAPRESADRREVRPRNMFMCIDISNN